MIVSKKHRQLVLNLSAPDRVLNAVPLSRRINFRGRDLVAVKHATQTVRILRNIGINAPGPIRYYYDWPGMFKPFAHQIDTADFLTVNPRAYCLNDMGCVDASTEYLSPTGWKRIDQYDGGPVAQYWPETGKADFVQPTEYVKRPCETMIRFKTSRGVDQLLSPEHRVLYKASTGSLQVTSAAHVLRRHTESKCGWKGRILTTFDTDGGAGVALDEWATRLQVAVQADGHFPNRTAYCMVRLKKQRKKDRLRKLLRLSGTPWKERDPEYASAPGFTVFTFQAPIRSKTFDWAWPCTKAQLEYIADEVSLWDGSTRKSASTEYFSSVKPCADFVQYAFAATGRTASLLTYTRQDGSIEYVVHARATSAALYVCGARSGGEKSDTVSVEPSPDGFKYCFTVPSTFLVLRRNGCIFMTGNTGKSLSALWAYDFMRKEGLIEGSMLVVGPLSTLERTWADEVFRHLPHLNVSVLYGTAERRLKLLEQGADILVINHDGIKNSRLLLELEKRVRDGRISVVVPDELAAFRNSRTERWKALKHLVHPAQYAWGLTGTPIPNEPTDAFGQIKLLTPSNGPKYFNGFRDATMQQVSTYKWVQRSGALEYVYGLMQPAIRYSRDDCIDLPPTTYQTRHAELTAEQDRAYKEMVRKMRVEIADKQITALNEATAVNKLLQICVGVAYSANGDVEIPAESRIELVEELIEQSSGKVIVFVPFRGALNYLADRLRKHTEIAVVHGGVSKNERDQIFGDFQKSRNPRVLVAQPGTMSHGLTLTEANTIVWFAPINSADTYVQACARIVRPGQVRNTLVVHIEGSFIERKMYERLQRRTTTQGVLLEMFKEG